MQKIGVLIFILFFVSNVCADCEKNQININTAEINELDELYGIGPTKSQAIMDFRENEKFGSLNDLINVKGIGEITLEKIKEQGLACVENEEGSEEEVEEEEETVEEIEEIPEETKENSLEEIKFEEIKEEETIVLNSKDIKTEESGELNKNRFATYGLFCFCLLLGFLYYIKQKSQIRKSEFR